MLVFPLSLRAQSLTSGSVTGTVVTDAGTGVPGALITLTASGAGASQQATTNGVGGFLFSVVSPGTYELRAEALGYHPLVARNLVVAGGERGSVVLRLTRGEPADPVIDTVSIAGSATSRHAGSAVRISARDTRALPHRSQDLASLAGLSTRFDASLGAQGLPGDMTLVYADGVPFYRAPFPGARGELIPDALFPRAAVSSVSALHVAPDIEWAGSGAGYVAVNTGSARSSDGVGVEAAWSGGPTWWSSELDVSGPDLLSLEGALDASVPIGDQGSRFEASGSVLRHQTPLAPRASESVSAQLLAMDPTLLTPLIEPAIETFGRYSGMLRADVRQSERTRIVVRGGGSYVQREFDGPGAASLAGAATPAEQSIDLSLGGGVLSAHSTGLTSEIRGGVSASLRDFDPSRPDMPSAYLTELGAVLGSLPGTESKSSRVDVVLTPTIHLTRGFGRLKFGAALRSSSHTMTHSAAELGDLAFADGDALLAGRGFGRFTTAPEESFTTLEAGIFAQYSATPAPGVRLVLGGRYDYERVSVDGLELNTDWLAASGLSNAEMPDSYDQLGAVAAFTWEPSPTAGTTVTIVGSLHHGDVDTRAFYEVFSRDTEATSAVFVGTGLDWLSPSPPAAAVARPTLTLLGPDARPPRSSDLSVGLSQRVGSTVTLLLAGSWRRTDFLLRRRDLNLPVVPGAMDPYGRSVYGALQQDGGLVTASGTDGRRFPAFADVWALDPDGWSEYRGVTIALEHAGEPVDFFASYTYAQTKDNWVGAASGAPDAALPPGLPATDNDWSEATSDFDAPHRLSAGAVARIGSASLAGTYTYRSGVPFTPRYRYGVDANGDGSLRNDVAWVPDAAELAAIEGSWPCLDDQAGGFAARNSCRGPKRHSLDTRLSVVLGSLGSQRASIFIDALNLLEGGGGVLDDALLLVDPAGTITTSPDGDTVTVPVVVNPGFGEILHPSSRGRMVRFGVRIGG